MQVDLYATDPEEVERLWKFLSKYAGGPSLIGDNIQYIQQRYIELTETLCLALGEPNLSEACKLWFSRPGAKTDGTDPFRGELRPSRRRLLKACSEVWPHWRYCSPGADDGADTLRKLFGGTP